MGNRRSGEWSATRYNPAMSERGKSRRERWNWLLLLPLLALIFPGFYSRSSPVLFGFPFFYWYQFALVAATAILTGIVYLATRD